MEAIIFFLVCLSPSCELNKMVLPLFGFLLIGIHGFTFMGIHVLSLSRILWKIRSGTLSLRTILSCVLPSDGQLMKHPWEPCSACVGRNLILDNYSGVSSRFVHE